MDINELIKYLKNNENKKFILQFKGIISMTTEINNTEIKMDNMYLLIKNIKSEKEKAVLNLHQLIKFNIIKKNEVLLEFDQLQKVLIKIE